MHLDTDSTYVRNGIMTWVPGWMRNGWMPSARQPVRNADLWKQLLAACEKQSSRADFKGFGPSDALVRR